MMHSAGKTWWWSIVQYVWLWMFVHVWIKLNNITTWAVNLSKWILSCESGQDVLVCELAVLQTRSHNLFHHIPIRIFFPKDLVTLMQYAYSFLGILWYIFYQHNRICTFVRSDSVQSITGYVKHIFECLKEQ